MGGSGEMQFQTFIGSVSFLFLAQTEWPKQKLNDWVGVHNSLSLDSSSGGGVKHEQISNTF